jgi:hypothetical protein
VPDPAKVLDAAQQEEQRKRGKRLARKNGGALGSATYNPSTNGSAEHAEELMQSKQTTIAVTTSKRFSWTERKLGDVTELVIMDGKKVYDFYRPDEIQEMQAVIEKLNADAEAGTLGTAMAAD